MNFELNATEWNSRYNLLFLILHYPNSTGNASKYKIACPRRLQPSFVGELRCAGDLEGQPVQFGGSASTAAGRVTVVGCVVLTAWSVPALICGRKI